MTHPEEEEFSVDHRREHQMTVQRAGIVQAVPNALTLSLRACSFHGGVTKVAWP